VGVKKKVHNSSSLHQRQLLPESGAEVVGERPMTLVTEMRVLFDECEGIVTCLREHGDVSDGIGDTERRHAALSRAEEVSGSAQRKIRFGDRESIRRPHHRGEPAFRRAVLFHRFFRFSAPAEAVRALCDPSFGHQDAIRLIASASDASAQLMQL
jgi:hypothetical protein